MMSTSSTSHRGPDGWNKHRARSHFDGGLRATNKQDKNPSIMTYTLYYHHKAALSLLYLLQRVLFYLLYESLFTLRLQLRANRL